MKLPQVPLYYAPDVILKIEKLGHGRVLTAADVATRELDTFLEHTQFLCLRLAARFENKSLVTRFVLTEADQGTNAFAYPRSFSSRDSLVILQHALLKRIRSYTGGATILFAQMLAEQGGEQQFRQRWGGVPVTEETVDEFAALVAHISLAFLIHHEMAHVAYRHTDFYLPAGAAHACVDEHAAMATRGDNPAARLRVRATELDADIHALEWTRQYLHETAARHSERPVGGENEAVNRVWSRFLTIPANLRFVLLLGCHIALLAMHRNAFRLDTLEAGTHPPIAMRLVALGSWDAKQYVREGKRYELSAQLNSLHDAMGVHAYHWHTEARLAKLKAGSRVASLEPITDALLKAYTDTGLGVLAEAWETWTGARERLMAERLSIDADIKRAQLVPSDMDVAWYV